MRCRTYQLFSMRKKYNLILFYFTVKIAYGRNTFASAYQSELNLNEHSKMLKYFSL